MMQETRKILLVFGTRPEAIKMAPLYHALRAEISAFETRCCVTGQHREMLDQVLRTFDINPDIDLNLMRDGQNLVDVHAGVLAAVRTVLNEDRPDLVLVHGDTTTSMASAQAAFYAGIDVGHIEAGLRSGDMLAPFPEELNRRTIGMVAKYHFAPTDVNKANLLAEGCPAESIVITGNTVVDAMRSILQNIDSNEQRRRDVEAGLTTALPFNWRDARSVIVTCHRRETFSGGLQQVCSAMQQLAMTFPDVHFIYPCHMNPAVREPVTMNLSGRSNLHLVEPLPYDAFLLALRHCHAVLTDSGGLQEEGPVLGKPVLVMRNATERGEAITAGGVRLVGTDCAGIVAGMSELLSDSSVFRRMSSAQNPYGDGNAAGRICAFLKQRAYSPWGESAATCPPSFSLPPLRARLESPVPN